MSQHAQSHTLELLGGNNAPECENRSLRFSRFTDPSLKDENRHAFLDVAIQQRCPVALINATRDSHLTLLESVPDAALIYMENQSRLLLNMAGGVMENAGVSLERFSGMPRIPGSAVKGVARTAAIQQLLDAEQNDKADLLAKIALAFGWVSDNWQDKPSKKQKLMDGTPAPREDFFYACPENFPEIRCYAKKEIKRQLNLPEKAPFPKQFAGLVAFFDALPVRSPQGRDLQLDIVTSHHPKYYKGEMDVALDIESPNPVVFPAIAAHHVFTFAVAPCPASKFFGQELRLRLRDAAKSWLVDGLAIFGIGAKTAAGYGWFSYDEAESEVIRDRLVAERQRDEDDRVFRAAIPLLPNLDEVAPENLQAAIATVEAFLGRWNGREVLQPIRDRLARNRVRLPRQNPVDRIRMRWNAMNERAIINGEIPEFERRTDEEKSAIVEILREPGNPIWQQLRAGQRGRVAAAVDAIRRYCRDTLNLGRMP